MKIRWKDLAIALVLAVVLWYSVSGSEKVESQVDIRVEYKGLPQGFIIREGLINKLLVRIRASVGLLRSINADTVTYSLDLSSVKKGKNELPVLLNQIPFWGGVEVIDVMPSVINLMIDTLEKKKIPLNYTLQGAVPPDLSLVPTFSPSEIEVSGPSNLIDSLQALPVSFAIPSTLGEGSSEYKTFIAIPEGVNANIREALISFNATLKRQTVRVSRVVQAEAAAGGSFTPLGNKVLLTVSLPVSQAKNAANNERINATVRLQGLAAGQHTLPIQANLPPGVELLAIEPSMVPVTVKKHDPSPEGD